MERGRRDKLKTGIRRLRYADKTEGLDPRSIGNGMYNEHSTRSGSKQQHTEIPESTGEQSADAAGQSPLCLPCNIRQAVPKAQQGLLAREKRTAIFVAAAAQQARGWPAGTRHASVAP